MKYRLKFSDDLPKGGSGIFFDYMCETFSIDGWICVDARKAVLRHEDQWLKSIKEWHNKVSIYFGEEDKYWWLSQASRIVVWKIYDVFSLKPLLFSLAIVDSIEKTNSDVWIKGANKEVVSYIMEWANRSGCFEVENEAAHQKISREIAEYVVSMLIPLKNYLRDFFRICKDKFFAVRVEISKKHVMVNSMVLNSDVAKYAGDHYFGKMLDHPMINQNDLMWVYGDGGSNSSEKRRVLNSQNKNFIFTNNYSSWCDVFCSAIIALKINLRFQKKIEQAPILSINGKKQESFSINFYTKLIKNQFPIDGVYRYKQYRKIIKKINPEIIIYPYEEHISERSILLASNEINCEIKNYGFAHAAYSKGHLFLGGLSMINSPKPNSILVTGETARKLFIGNGALENNLIILGSPRFKLPEQHKLRNQNNNKLKILLIFGYGFEFLLFSKMIVRNKDFISNYELEVRRSFHSWKSEQDEAERILKINSISYTCKGGDLNRQILDSDIVIFEHTTAGLEASLLGKLVIRLALSEIIPTTLFGADELTSPIKYCDGLDSLAREIYLYENMNTNERVRLVKAQQEIVRKLISPIDSSILQQILK